MNCYRCNVPMKLGFAIWNGFRPHCGFGRLPDNYVGEDAHENLRKVLKCPLCGNSEMIKNEKGA